MDYKYLANLLFFNINKSPEYYEELYPDRNVNFVTRFAPSPTGFIHMGSLYVAFISEIFARKNNGVFILRIEDTDQKRKIDNGIENIISNLKDFEIKIDEGAHIGGKYGPYVQSERKEIYLSYAKRLVELGYAYPCFCTKEELDEIKHAQENNKERTGYYGKWARSRNLDIEQIKANLNNKIPFVIRLKSNGNFNNKIIIKDLIKGNVEFPENDMDIVLIKSDGLPTYHFAHVIDDHLMHANHVIRGDEWLSSLPLHYQLFRMLNFKVPKYAHIAPITKKVGDTIRKLSKRYDPECSINFYYEKGIPNEVIKIYLATLINSNFEEWYDNSDGNIYNFNFDFKKMSISGSLFDYDKLISISKTYFSKLSAIAIYTGLLNFYKESDEEFYNILLSKREYTLNVLNIERNKKRPRKDMSCYADFKSLFSYMYKEYFYKEKEKFNLKINNYKEILNDFYDNYDMKDSEEIWMEKIRNLCDKYNYAKTMKIYNENPIVYNGNITDICTLIRFSITFRYESPNIYEILKILGEEEIKHRIDYFICP